MATGTGEHGVGVGKKEYLVDELGADTVELMWTIKRAVDPLNIMNPGKASAGRLSEAYSTDVRCMCRVNIVIPRPNRA